MIVKEGISLAEGRYELRRRIGSGGMASVWRARDCVLGRSVAVKVPGEPIAADPTFVRRFEHEARTAAGLTHPNLVSIYDYGVDDDRPYLVMEFVDGESLAERAERGAPTDVGALAAALLGALDHIHGAGIVHRDVKPGNVLIDRQGRILLTDFGIAQSEEALSLTGTGQVVGTLSYIAPEIMDGKRATPRSDLYSAGIVLRDFLERDSSAQIRSLVESLAAEDPGERPGSAATALAIIGASRTGAMLPAADLTDSTAAMGAVAVGEAEPDPTPVEEPSAPVDARVPPLPPMSRTGLPAGDSRPHGSRWRVLAPLVVIAVIAAVVVIAVGSGGDDGSGGGGGGQKVAEKSSDKGSGSGQSEAENGSGGEPSTVDSGTTDASTGLPAVTDPDPERGYQLNAEGKQQLDAGDYEGAVATLEDAVAAYPEDSTDVNYAYALFNYAQALRLSGNPEAAIPVLKKRLTFDDQTETVQAELEAARAAAG